MKGKKAWVFAESLISTYQLNTYPESENCIQRVERFEFDIILEPAKTVTIYREWANQKIKHDSNFKKEWKCKKWW